MLDRMVQHRNLTAEQHTCVNAPIERNLPISGIAQCGHACIPGYFRANAAEVALLTGLKIIEFMVFLFAMRREIVVRAGPQLQFGKGAELGNPHAGAKCAFPFAAE